MFHHCDECDFDLGICHNRRIRDETSQILSTIFNNIWLKTKICCPTDNAIPLTARSEGRSSQLASYMTGRRGVEDGKAILGTAFCL